MPIKSDSGEKPPKKRFAGIQSFFYDALIENGDGRASDRRARLYSSYFSSIAGSMVSGMYFTGLLVKLDASDEYIAYINMIISASTFIQMLAPFLMERFSKRKNLLLTLKAITWFLNIVFIAAIPFLPVSKMTQLALFMLTVIAIYTLSALTAPGLGIWQMQCLPHSKRADYFSVSSLTSSLINLPTSFLVALLLDTVNEANITLGTFPPELLGFYILRIFAVIAAVFEMKFLLRMKEYPYEEENNPKERKNSLSLFILPLKNRAFMQTIAIMVLYNFAAGIIGQYYTIYCLDIVNLSYTYLNFSSMVCMPITLIMTPIWAKLINRFGWFKMLVFGISGYTLAILSNAFVTTTTQYVYILVSCFCAMFGPCTSINFSNIPYMKMPSSNQTVYLSFSTVITSLGLILGNLVGLPLFRVTDGIVLRLFGFDMLNYQYICILQGILCMFVVCYVAVIRHVLRKDPANAGLNL